MEDYQVYKKGTLADRPTSKFTTTNDTNAIRKAVNALGQVPHFAMPGRRFPWEPPWIGVITETGPKGDEENYPDERYWVRRSAIDGTDATQPVDTTGGGESGDSTAPADTTTALTTSYYDEPAIIHSDTVGSQQPTPIVITATNLCEGSLDKEEAPLPGYQSGTHLLIFGQRVVVWSDTDTANPPNVRYFFVHPVSRMVRVRITTAADGAGKYNGRIIYPSQEQYDPTTDLIDAEVGDENPDDEDDCWVSNLAELNQTGHALTDGGNTRAVYLGIVRSRKRGGDTTTDRHVVEIGDYDYQDCTTPSAPLII